MDDLSSAMSLWLLGPIGILFFWLWGWMNGKIGKHYTAMYRPFPTPIQPSYIPSKDVSVLVPTVDTPDIFILCLRQWLENDPLEVIIVTVKQNHDRIIELLCEANLTRDMREKIKLFCIPTSRSGKREKMKLGLQKVRGQIVTAVDDHIQWGPNYLKSMLPAFEDAHVGAVGSAIRVWIPQERRNSATITV